VSAKVEAKTLIEPANSYRALAIPQAVAKAHRLQEEANAYAKQIFARAQGDPLSFQALLREYNANPAFIRARLYAEMLETVVPKMRISMILPSSTDDVKLLLSPQVPLMGVWQEHNYHLPSGSPTDQAYDQK
jgi:modulator of FtsH protease HflK